MSVQKRRYGWLSVALVMLPLTALLSGCGSKTDTAATMPPASQQQGAVDTQQGIAAETARRQAEQAAKEKRKNAAPAP